MPSTTLTQSKKYNPNTQPVYKKRTTNPRIRGFIVHLRSDQLILPPSFSKIKMSYQIDKACDIITMALTIRLGKGGITDARTSQNSTYRSHREYHLMAGDSLVRLSLRQVTFLVSAI